MRKSIKSKSTPSLIKFSVSDRAILNKKVQLNPRYSHVKSRTNTGSNITSKQEIEKEIRTYYKVQPDEAFRRISLHDLIQVIVAHSDENDYLPLPPEQIISSTCEDDSTDVPIKYRDNVNAVIHNSNSDTPCNSARKLNNEYPFIIIDVRPHREFLKYHFAFSINHPLSKLNRAIGWENGMMIAYKNHPFWIIVLCDDSEDLAPQAASILLHRGYSNVFVLSGGLKLASDKIGSPLVTADDSKFSSPKLIEILKEWVSIAGVQVPPLNIGGDDCWLNEEGRSRGKSLQRTSQRDKYGASSKTRGRSLNREPIKKHWR